MTIDEMIAVLQAAKEGKQIQGRNPRTKDDKWRDVQNPSWSFHHLEYRVKPEPREITLLEIDGELQFPRFAGTHSGRLIHFREVIE